RRGVAGARSLAQQPALPTDDREREMPHRDVGLGSLLPADENSTESIHPAMRTLDHPAEASGLLRRRRRRGGGRGLRGARQLLVRLRWRFAQANRRELRVARASARRRRRHVLHALAEETDVAIDPCLLGELPASLEVVPLLAERRLPEIALVGAVPGDLHDHL